MGTNCTVLFAGEKPTDKLVSKLNRWLVNHLKLKPILLSPCKGRSLNGSKPFYVFLWQKAGREMPPIHFTFYFLLGAKNHDEQKVGGELAQRSLNLTAI